MRYKPSPSPAVTLDTRQFSSQVVEFVSRELRRIGLALQEIEEVIASADGGGGGGAGDSLQYLTVVDERAALPNSRRIAAGTNVSFDYSASDRVVVNVTLPDPPSLSALPFVTYGDGDDPISLMAGPGIELSLTGSSLMVSAPGSGISIDDVRDALNSDSQFRGEVIGSLWPGVVLGTVDGAQRELNGELLQAAIDYCVGYRLRFRLLRGVHQIDLPGGLLIRAVGVDNTTGEIVPAGTAGSTLANPTGFTWIAPINAEIQQYASNTPIIVVGYGVNDVFGIDFYGCTLHYGQNEGANSGSTAMLLGPLWLCRIGGVRISSTITPNQSFRGMYNPTTTFFFSNHLYDIKIFRSTQSLLEICSTGTGNLFNNIYLSGVTTAGLAGSVVTPFRYQHQSFGQAHGNICNQFNIEWCISNILMTFANLRGLTMNGVHLEQNRLTGAHGTLALFSISDVNFNGLMVLDNRWETSIASGNCSLFRMANDSGVCINGLSLRINSSSYLQLPLYMVWQGDGYDGTPGKCTITNFKTQDAGNPGSLKQFLKIDRTLELSDFGQLGVIGIQQVYSCPEPGSWMIGAEFSRNATSVLYGAMADAAYTKFAGSLSSTMNFQLSKYMGPAGTRMGLIPCRRGMQQSIRRNSGAQTGVLSVRNLEDGTVIAADMTVATTLRLVFDGVRWTTSIKGSQSMMVRYASGAITINDDDDIIVVDATSGTATVSLPPLAQNRSRPLTIKKADGTTNTVIIDGNSAETIDGSATQVIGVRYASMTIVGGDEWLVI